MSNIGISLFFFMFMIIGMVNGRWTEADMFPTSTISDGVPSKINENPPNNLHMVVSNSSDNTTTSSDEKRCHSIYGFLPCADTMEEGVVFLLVFYTSLMMLGEEWIHKGSHVLVMLLGDGATAPSSFRVFISFPRTITIFISVVETSVDVQRKVKFAMGIYAGSTVITLTLIWGLRIISFRDKLRGKGSTPEYEDQQHSSLVRKFSVLKDTGVNIDKETGQLAVIMLLSLLPFSIVEIVAMSNTPFTIWLAFTMSGVSLLSYHAYQMCSQFITARSIVYLKQENLQTRFFYDARKLVEYDLIDENGNHNFKVFESIFKSIDMDNCHYISRAELEDFMYKLFGVENDRISKEYANAEILTHFDDDGSGKIDLFEFQMGCTKWLQKWKNVADNSDLVSKNLWKQVKRLALRRRRANITQIEKIVQKILKQVLKQQQLVTEDEEANIQTIEELFLKYNKDSNQEIQPNVLKHFVETLQLGASLDYDTLLNGVIDELPGNFITSIKKKEFVDGFVRWIEKTIGHHPSFKDPKQAMAAFEEDSWEDIDANMKMELHKAKILYLIFGSGIVFLISGAFVQTVVKFSDASQISFLFTSFVIVPIAINSKIIIMAVFHAWSHVYRNASLQISEIYSGLVMNNLSGLLTLLATIYMRGLSWCYSAEMLTIMMPCTIVGLFALRRNTYPLWAAFIAILLYPISVYLYYVLES